MDEIPPVRDHQPTEGGPVNRHPIACLGSLVLWALLLLLLPKPWGHVLAALGLVGYGVWVLFQKHDPIPDGALATFPRQRSIELEFDRDFNETKQPADTLLRPAETITDGETLLRPAPNSESSNTDGLLRSSSEDGR